MKRIACLMLTLTLTICFLGCDNSDADTISFCYLRGEYIPGQIDSVMVFEERDLSGHPQDIGYLLGIYLEGPLEDTLVSPFPDGTSLVEIIREKDTLTIELTKEFLTLDGIRLTLAASCLSSTCFHLTDVQTVQITCGDEAPVVISRDSLTLLDDSSTTTEMASDGQ